MRWVIALLVILLLALQLRLWHGDGGIQEVLRLQAAVTKQRQENAALGRRNQALAADVRELKQGLQGLEERARSELGMIGPGETFYQIVSHDDH